MNTSNSNSLVVSDTIDLSQSARTTRSPQRGALTLVNADSETCIKQAYQLHIPKSQIDASHWSPAVDILNTLTATKEAVLRYRGAVSLVLSGYAHDQRDISEDPTVQEFIKVLNGGWGYWLYFLNPCDGSLALIVSSLRRGGSGDGLTLVNLCVDMNRLFEKYGLPRARTAFGCITAFDTAFGGDWTKHGVRVCWDEGATCFPAEEAFRFNGIGLGAVFKRLRLRSLEAAQH